MYFGVNKIIIIYSRKKLFIKQKQTKLQSDECYEPISRVKRIWTHFRQAFAFDGHILCFFTESFIFMFQVGISLCVHFYEEWKYKFNWFYTKKQELHYSIDTGIVLLGLFGF